MQEQLAGVCSLPAIWVLGNEFRFAYLAASACTHWAILSAQSWVTFGFIQLMSLLAISEIKIHFHYI